MKSHNILKLVAMFPVLTVQRLVLGDHIKVYLNTPAGRKILVVSRTASDYRADMNNKSLLRRWARGQV